MFYDINILFILKDMSSNYYSKTLKAFRRKLELISLCGGGCKNCGYKKNISALEFHHRDPTKKKIVLDLKSLGNNSMKTILEELDKCDLLCANCHRELHNPQLEFNTVVELTKGVINHTAIVQVRKYVTNPNCKDCGVKITYKHSRCITCASKIKIKHNKPNIELLNEEYNTYGVSWCSRKYNADRKTIKKWLKLI